MRFQLLTIFPDFFTSPFEYGVVARARTAGLIEIETHDLRNWTFDRHRTVDDRPFGGDEGMVMKVEPIALALEELERRRPEARQRKALLSAQGKLFDQGDARRLGEYDEVVLVCGRYEGVDERVVAQGLVDEELSVGSFVLSGGEWAAGMIVDSVARLLPGVLGNEASSRRESFSAEDAGRVGVLDYPHYTRPADFRGWTAPEVLLSGDHEKIRLWRRRAALEKTLRNRPDLLETAALSEEDREILDEITSVRK
jgi:tRNA (guanine37-N1)-methyltransferase